MGNFQALYAQLRNNAFEVKGVQISLADDESSEFCFEEHILG